MMEELQKQLRNIANAIMKLERFVGDLRNQATIPHDVEQAFRSRLRIGELAKLGVSTKTAGSETQAVAEGGASSYDVAKPMDGFVTFRLPDGSEVNIPYYT